MDVISINTSSNLKAQECNTLFCLSFMFGFVSVFSKDRLAWRNTICFSFHEKNVVKQKTFFVGNEFETKIDLEALRL